MNRISPILAFLILLGCLSSTTRAEMTTKEFISTYDKANPEQKKVLEAIVGAVGNGISWAEASMKTERKICPPAALALTNSQVLSILRNASAHDQLVDSEPYGLAILLSLERAFPCDKIPK